MGEHSAEGFADPLAAAFSVIQSRQMKPETMNALWLISEGMSYLEVESLTGISKSQLWVAARRHGLLKVHNMRQRQRSRRRDAQAFAERMEASEGTDVNLSRLAREA